jgi:hypothetical protein
LGFVRVMCPSSDMPAVRPLREGVSATARPEAATLRVSFRPRGFAPPRRFAPLGWSRACCIPEPDRVRSVSRPRAYPTLTEVVIESAPGRFPRRLSHPSKNSPHQQRHRVTTAVALLPLPPHRPSGSTLPASGSWFPNHPS